MYLLDTNIVLYFLEAALPESGKQFLNKIVDIQSNISIITKMEALGFNFNSDSDEIVMKTFVNGSNILNINDEVADKTIAIRKNKKRGLPDAIIAATAVVNDLTLVTRNKNDFKNIQGLKIINPFDI